MIDPDPTVLGVVTTLDAGPLHFLAGRLPVDAEPSGALLDELLSRGRAALPLPKLTALVRVNDRHTLTCSLFSRRREVGVLVLVGQCAGCSASAWDSVIEGAPRHLRPALRAASPRPPWGALLIDDRRLPPWLFEHSGASLWDLVSALGAAWSNAAAVMATAGPMIE